MRAWGSGRLRSSSYTRGRLAAVCCVGYLLAVLVAGSYTIGDAVFVDTIGASFAGLPLIILTAPLSFAASPLIGMSMSMAFPTGGGVGMVVLNVLLLFALALVQAYIGWLVLRGPRVEIENSALPAAP